MSASLWRPEPGSPRRCPRLPHPTLPLPAGPVAAPQDLCPAPSSVRLPRPQHAGVLSCQDSEKGLGPFTGPGLPGPALPSAHEARGPSRRDSLSLSLPLRSFHWLQAVRQVKVRPVSPGWVAPRAPVDTPAWPRAPPLWPAPCGAPQAVSDAAAHTWQTHADTHTHGPHALVPFTRPQRSLPRPAGSLVPVRCRAACVCHRRGQCGGRAGWTSPPTPRP